MKSIVKWFSDKKGYGYIEYKANGDISVYYYEIQNNEEYETTIKKEV